MDEKPEPQFIVNLKSFIDEVHKAFNDEDYEFKKPNVFPIKKKNTLGEDGKFECRPISTFSLKDKLILSLVNQYLTQKLDPHFYNNSHAFRAKSEEGERKDHHSSIASLYKYKVGRLESELWVAECDMRNFYDSVNHNVIKRHFQDMIKVCAKAGTFVDPRAIRVFEKYLDAYAFNVDVLPLNGDLGYWNSKRISGKYTWVQSQLESMNLYSDIKSERIGNLKGVRFLDLLRILYFIKQINRFYQTLIKIYSMFGFVMI
jgi:hypothetical protein